MNPNNSGFVDRESELAFLEGIYAKGGRQLAVLWGRRRVGKTELALHFCTGKNAIYFLADKRGTESNAQRFAEIASRHFKDVAPLVKNFDDAFAYVKARAGNQKIVAVIDEFSYLVEKDGSIPSVFQLAFDEVLKGTNVFLVLSGSSVSMMYDGALSYESPLYGRRSGEWRLKAMPFRHARKFFAGQTFEEAFLNYCVAGGIPAYASRFAKKGVFENVDERVLAKGEFLYSEPELLLKEELREPSTYFSILEAMANAAKLSDIAMAAHVNATDMPKYLKVLESLEIVRREKQVTEKKPKKTLYFIEDNFFRFWFKFVFPKKSELESGRREEAFALIKRDFNAFAGKTFEGVCKEYLQEKRPAPFSEIGMWWGAFPNDKGEKQAVEIDLVSIDEASKTILFAECKWQSNVDAGKILGDLKEKAQKVEWHGEGRNEFFAVFAKSFKEKTLPGPRERRGLFFIDANELDKTLK